MKQPTLKLLFVAALLAFVPAHVAYAQYPVTDAGAQALLSQGNLNFLQQMATELGKLDTQITHLETIQNQGQQVLSLMGNPSQALSFASGSMGLNTSTLSGSSLFQSMNSIASGANGARSLLNTGGGIFQAIATTTSSGDSVTHDPNTYKKFDAFEQELQNFQAILTQAQGQRQTLLTQLQTVMGSAASTDAEQSEKIARINALSAQLRANDEVIRDADEQRQAQHEANTQDSEKQKQAEQDELNTEFQQLQPQADQKADAGLSSILQQKP
jgi:hypothetical protein